MKEYVENALFLDFDGVMLSKQGHLYHEALNRRTLAKTRLYEQFCPIAMSNLNLIAEHVPNLAIVLSTSWRKDVAERGGDPVQELGDILEKAGFEHRNLLHSYTPIPELDPNGWRTRGRKAEINAWFERYRCGKYVILDDIPNLGSRHVFCDDLVGLDLPTMFSVFEMFEVAPSLGMRA